MSVRRWFSYNGTGAVSLPSSYIYSPANPACINGFNLCAIYAVYTTVGPSRINANLESYIASLLSTGLAQPSGFPLFEKLFVYGKS